MMAELSLPYIISMHTGHCPTPLGQLTILSSTLVATMALFAGMDTS